MQNSSSGLLNPFFKHKNGYHSQRIHRSERMSSCFIHKNIVDPITFQKTIVEKEN